MAESQSMGRAALAVSLVNLRFTSTNPCAWPSVPFLGHYMTLETVLVTDDSREDTALLSGPSFEVDRVLLEHAKRGMESRFPRMVSPQPSTHVITVHAFLNPTTLPDNGLRRTMHPRTVPEKR